MTISPSRLEREIAQLTGYLRSQRMTPAEHAAFHNGLARAYWINGPRPVYNLESRIDDLIMELRKW